MEVLLCTDDKDTLEDITMVFNLAFPDCNLIAAGTREQCIDLIKHNPDIFIISIKGIDGMFDFKLIKELRAISSNPIVVVSPILEGEDVPHDIELLKSMRAGADVYINQPINNIVFMAKLRSLINREINKINKYKTL
jgi:DNA-binding response OmpR family regulator